MIILQGYLFRRLEMTKRTGWVLTLLLPLVLLTACQFNQTSANTLAASVASPGTVILPVPVIQGAVSLEETLNQRRSIREYSSEPLTLAEVGQILWATQGRTSESGGRTAPSAGGLYPLDLFVAVGNVQSLSPGIYQYDSEKHRLVVIRVGDLRADLSSAALGQPCIKDAPIGLVIAAVYSRVTGKYGERGVRYAHLEAGHAAQNACLEITALGLGAVTIGAFEDEKVQNVCGLNKEQEPLYVIPVGEKR
jgi:SagB-type dehydrogenase family enzyme